jgi:hypothetical protein
VCHPFSGDIHSSKEEEALTCRKLCTTPAPMVSMPKKDDAPTCRTPCAVTGRGHAPVAFMARGGGARCHHRGRKGPRARHRLGQRGMHAAQGICSRARSGAPLAASASEDLVADPSELPRLRRRTSMKTQLAPVGPHESLVLRPPQVGSSLPHPLAAAHPAASYRGSSQPLHRASPSPCRVSSQRPPKGQLDRG